MALSRDGDRRDYAFGPVVRLRVHASGTAARHFASEFGPASPAADRVHVEVDVGFSLRVPTVEGRRFAAGGYKTVRWLVALSHPDERPLRAWIRISGGPPGFALSLVQGYIVEPLVAAALARAGQVALPSAALSWGDGAVVLMGRSGTGKSSVSMRELARGRPVLGDDQVVLDDEGCCWAYPRRLRVYSDLKATAPAAWARLPASRRRALLLRRAVRRLSRGFIAPSLAVDATELGPRRPDRPLPARRLVVVERAGDVRRLTALERDTEWAVGQARDVLIGQRGRFLELAEPPWPRGFAEVLERETEVFRAGVAQVPVEHVRIPPGWPAARAVAALDAYVTAP